MRRRVQPRVHLGPGALPAASLAAATYVHVTLDRLPRRPPLVAGRTSGRAKSWRSGYLAPRQSRHREEPKEQGRDQLGFPIRHK